MKKTLLIAVVIFLILSLVIGIGTLYIVTSQSEQMTEQERALMVDGDAVAEWLEDWTVDPNKETVVKSTYFDRSFELEYEYHAPDDGNAPYITYTITKEKSKYSLGAAESIGFVR